MEQNRIKERNFKSLPFSRHGLLPHLNPLGAIQNVRRVLLSRHNIKSVKYRNVLSSEGFKRMGIDHGSKSVGFWEKLGQGEIEGAMSRCSEPSQQQAMDRASVFR